MIPEEISFVQCGLGPIGLELVQQAFDRENLRLVGAVDISPEFTGQDVGAILPEQKLTGIPVTANLKETLKETRPRVLVHATVSSFRKAYPQLLEAVQTGSAVVSTCEELSYPWQASPDLSDSLDRAAKYHNVAVLGTGVNPGFLMDALVLTLTGVSKKVETIAVHRIIDASKRRLSFQEKIGVGLDIATFKERVKGKTLGHKGFHESIHMVADGLGWRLDRVTQRIEPVVAETSFRSPACSIKKGDVIGLRQEGCGYSRKERKIVLKFEAYLNAENPCDRIRLEGTPPLVLEIPGGVPGDTATASIVLNAIPRILMCPPGLITMRDLPLIHWRA
ncbi:MAG: dihydrodipicolinate reductase [Armatimonadetes bacterium]|nr:dihydrodipicolinate reductase [Armatimonadota bacterium]